MQKLQKESSQLENAASQLLTQALKEGTESAEVCGTYAAKTKVTLEKQDFHMASSDEGFLLGLRVLKNGRQGFASCNSCETRDLKEVAKRAVEISEMSPENPYQSITPSENIPAQDTFEIWDDALHGLSLHTQKDWTQLLANEATSDPRFRLNEGSVTISSGLFLVMNSLGTHKIDAETSAVWGLMGMGVDGEKITSFDYFHELSRVARGTPDRIVATTKTFRDEVLANLKQGPAESYKGLVVFSPRAVADIFLHRLANHVNGRSVVEQTARWGVTDLGKAVLHPSITIKDSPWLPDRFSATRFDREGVPTRPLIIFDQGTLKAFLMDQYAAKALKMKSTGHAAGGPAAVPTVGSHCFVMTGGSEPKNALLKRVTEKQKHFLLVHRFSGQVDATTGDFSGVAKGAEWWNGGERAYYVQETLISGNLFDCLSQSLFGLSKETVVVQSQEEAPLLVCDNVSVTTAKK